MTDDVNANDIVAFFVELGALVLLGFWAWRIAPDPRSVRALAVVAVVGAAMALWGLFASPQAVFQVPALALVVKVIVLGGSVLAAFVLASSLTLPAIWAVLVVVNTTLLYAGQFAR